jgi:hypothetical protein
MEGIKIVDFKMLCHVAYTKKHTMLERGTFNAPGMPLHERVFKRETHTPLLRSGNFGKPKVIFYLDEPKSPTFGTIQELIEFYTL